MIYCSQPRIEKSAGLLEQAFITRHEVITSAEKLADFSNKTSMSVCSQQPVGPLSLRWFFLTKKRLTQAARTSFYTQKKVVQSLYDLHDFNYLNS